jgi:wyosine [tRNA(Phe)-imidazoG37] synthetase (radical SAM superfamily)
MQYFSEHLRYWRDFKLVYPVISRRSHGLSVGINLNPNRMCNFDCIYCEVNRRDATKYISLKADISNLKQELLSILRIVKNGKIWREPEFANIPKDLQQAKDIAFSGDGEPTSCPRFQEAVQIAIDARGEVNLPELKLVLITNATLFHRPTVQKGLRTLIGSNGEIWAKLDAGTRNLYYLVNNTHVDYIHILDNLLFTAKKFPITIQTCMMRIRGNSPSEQEILSYCERLSYIMKNGGNLSMIQLYTAARLPAQDYVTSLSEREMLQIASTIRESTNLHVEIFSGSIGL